MSSASIISLSENNPYAAGKLITYTDKKILLKREQYIYKPSIGDRFYQVQVGDMLDAIAWEYYKDIIEAPADRWWWLIADANNIYDPFNLSGYINEYIVIPDIQAALIERYG